MSEVTKEEIDLGWASTENVESTQDLILWMDSGYMFHGRLSMEHNRPKLRSSQEGINRIKIWFIEDVYHAIVDYLLSGEKAKNYSKLIKESYPKEAFEADYLYRHIKREIARGNECVTFREEDNGIRVIATYPYGSLDYGIFPHTLEELHEYLKDIEPFTFDYPTYDIPDLQNHNLPTEYKELEEDKHLDSVFPDKLIPSNTIIDKTICGCGATWLEIHADRNSIIIEPNVPVIIGKEAEHPNVIGIYGEDMTAEKLAERIREQTGWIKLMTTPDSYPKIVTAFKEELHLPLYNDYFLLFDECERIVSDIDFRKNIALPIDDFFKFKDKAMVSATPIIIDDPRFNQYGFKIIKIVPTYDYRKNLKLIGTNIVPKTIQKELTQLDGTICVFYNSIEGITELIDFLKLDEEEVNIYCSSKALKDFKRDKRKNVYDSITDKLNHYNFFTSRFYSAVDIKAEDKPHVIMVSQVYKRIGDKTPFSLIDPETEAIQIAGRFRNGIGTLLHITNTDPNKLLFKQKEELELFLKEQHTGYHSLLGLQDNAQTEGEKFIIGQAIDNTDYKLEGYVTDKGDINYFRYNNAYLDERLKMLYCNPARLYKAYSRSGAFNIQSWGIFVAYSDEDRRILNSNRTPRVERIKRLHKIYSDATDINTQLDKALLDEIGRDNPKYLLYMDAFHYIGFHKMREMNFENRDIKKAIEFAKLKEQVTTPTIIKQVYSIFSENTFYANQFIDENLKKIWDAEKVKYTGQTMKYINFYFEAETDRTESERGWKLGLKRFN